MFAPSVYAARRAALARAVGSGVIVILGHEDAPMNYPANVYAFRQDASFLYYGGHDAPGLALAIDAETGRTTLFGHDPTLDDVVWEGPLAGLADRAAAIGAEAHAAHEALDAAVREALRAGRTVHTLPPNRAEQRLRLADLLGLPPAEVRASDVLIDAVVAQRLVKTDAEIAEMEASLVLAAEVHALAMAGAQPGRTERGLAAAIEAHLGGAGSYPSYPVILTRRGEILHGHPTGAVLEAGDLLLVDAGAVSVGTRYASDLTRTMPVGGTFSERQRALYDVVLAAQTAAIEAMRPGVPFRDLHTLAARTITTGLADLGLMRGDPDEAVAAGAHALFFPHGLGHALGLDVHDMEGLGEDRVGYGDGFSRSEQFGTRYLRFARPLAEGYVMTVEPGVYFVGPLLDAWAAEGRHAAFIDYAEADAWRGTGGIRIEDNVLVTPAGHRVLGPPVPRTADAVEAAVRAGA
ncbi:MAG TPA: aminopeptidase P family protein [Rubricoccaceae bacterium]|jgi:Xaa-Pro aminopeptidase